MSYDLKNKMATVVSIIGRLLGNRRSEEWVCLETDPVLTKFSARGLHHLRQGIVRVRSLERTSVMHPDHTAPCSVVALFL